MYNEMENISRAFKRYRFYYKLTDFIFYFLILYVLAYYLNIISFFSQYIEYYVFDSVSLDEIIVFGLSALIAILMVIIIYLKNPALTPIEMLESRYVWTRERLQTAWDKRDEDNVIINHLRSQVTSCLEKVDVGSFLNKKHLAIRLLVSLILLVSFIGFSDTLPPLEITPENVNRVIEDLGGNPLENIVSSEEEKNQDGKLDEDIYGDISVASIAGENVELTIISGLGTSVTIRNTGPEDKVQFVPSQTYPVDIISSAAADESYQAIQQLSSTDKDLIMEYAVLRSKLIKN
ncbi:MAG: hypothetical protein IBX40_02440 [Methanosarcinales archaeon]|nr:hypothetical protein [Methanosarcinales archaeon]